LTLTVAQLLFAILRTGLKSSFTDKEKKKD
jgi:hypothetical protein